MSARNSINTLVVPVEVAAMAVNTRARDTDGTYSWMRWQPTFQALAEQSLPPEPLPFDAEMWPGDGERRGIYLQWQLPEALARGRHDEDNGVGDFPLVPNRWLVVRYQAASRAVRAWLVESDHLGTTGTVSYLDPSATTPTATRIGRRHDITSSSPWREPPDARDPFLTALGPGLLTFSVFQPYNTNVFSLHDTLEDITGADRISYHVIGWYSTTCSDILATSSGSVKDLLDELDWLAPTATSATTRSLYSGSALNIDWQPQGDVPASNQPKPDDIAVSVGNSTAEAFSGLAGQAAGPGSLDTDEARLLRAFSLGTLDLLDRADGDELTDRSAHHSGFGPAPGGYLWRVVARGDQETRTAPSAAARAREEEITADLNRLQDRHDALESELAAIQERLYVLWALSSMERQPAAFRDRVRAELDPGNTTGTAGRVTALTRQLADLREQIPWATTPKDLEGAAARYADDHGMATDRTLQRVPREPHEQAADPVVLLQGSNLHAPMTRGSALPCRTADRTVTKAADITAASVQPDVNKVNTTGLHDTPAVQALLTEFFVLARARHAGHDLTGIEGTLPEYGTELWRQPWQPLYLMWQAEYVPLDFRDRDGTEHWTFDGNRYRWDGEGPVPENPVFVSGRQILTPTAGHDTDGKIAAYASGRTDLPESLIADLRENVRTLDLLSQRLEGFTAHISQRDARSTLRPTGTIGDLVGHGDHLAPVPGQAAVFPGQPSTSSPFYELRAGQLAFAKLAVVDRFGRTVNKIGNPQHFRYRRPDSMIPNHPVQTTDADRFVELSPRLLQPARLHFDFLDSTTGDDTNLTPGTNPICAWLLNNRLDSTLACYDPTGVALGELRTIATSDSQRAVAWLPLPGSPITTLDQLATVSPHAHHLLSQITHRGPAALDAFRRLLDDALATIDPEGPDDGSLGFLLGRPLALVRARLDLQLCGPVRLSVGWNEVLDPPAPAMPAWKWTVRLGQATDTDDGLIGYVLGDDYSHFDTTIAPADTANGYLRPIGTGDRLKLAFEGTSTATTTLLLDPRAAVHATADILPVASVHVPQHFTAKALARMSICFRTGPRLAPTTTDPDTAVIPQPATATGTWTWAEPAGTDQPWRHLPLTTPDPTDLPLGPPEIRTGFLVLNDAAEATR